MPAPPIVGGSHDPLLEWALRESHSGLASLPEGSEEGLRRLTRGEVMVAAIHLHRLDGDDETANLEAVAEAPGLHDAVVHRLCAARAGHSGRARQSAGPERHGLDRDSSRARMAQRPAGAGAQLLLLALLARAGIALDDLKLAKPAFPTGPDIAQAIRAGRIDCGIATRSVARSAGLDFLPLDLGALRPRDAPARLFHEGAAGAVRLHAPDRYCATVRPNSAAMMSAMPA